MSRVAFSIRDNPGHVVSKDPKLNGADLCVSAGLDRPCETSRPIGGESFVMIGFRV